MSANAEIESHLQYVIVAFGGQDRPFPVGDDLTVGALLNEAVEAFGVTSSPRFGLFTEARVELPDAETLRDAGVHDAAKLVLSEADASRLQYLIVAHNGEDKPFPAGDDEKVETLLKEAINAFGVVNSPHLFGLFTKAMAELSDAQTLKQAGVHDAQKLFLRQSGEGRLVLMISEGLVRETLQILHRCGEDRIECVVLWVGPADQPKLIDSALHPRHSSGAGGYEIDPTWMHGLWIDLSEQRRSVRAQVHTHPRSAFHSKTDDEYPAVQTAGFVSIVVPRFAHPSVSVTEIHASVLEAEGWRRSTFSEEVNLV